MFDGESEIEKRLSHIESVYVSAEVLDGHEGAG